MDNLQIINAIVSQLGDEYCIINGYNNDQDLDPNGTIAVLISDIENLHHGNAKDCRISISINGQILTENDLSQQKINTMFQYVFSRISEQWIKENIENCVGVLINSGNFSCDGESNNFGIALQLYLSIDEYQNSNESFNSDSSI